MAKVFLHIGGHKTGTSFLQSMFHRNRDVLARDAIHYPDIGPNNAHHALVRPWIVTPDIPDRFFGRAGPDGLWERLTNQYADAPGTLFLSAENFSRIRPTRVDMADLARRLAPFEEVQVIYTMRRQTELIPSVWTQVAKSRKAPGLRRTIGNALKERRVLGVPIDHGSVYAQILEGFAPQQIRLLDYSAICRARGGILGSFLALLGSTLDPAAFRPLDNDQLANVSPDPVAMFMACHIVRGGPPSPLLVEAIRKTVCPGPGKRTSVLTRSEHTIIQGRFADSNRLLAERVQPVQPGFTFDADDGLPPPFCREDITQQTWIDIATALYEDPPKTADPAPIWQRLGRT